MMLLKKKKYFNGKLAEVVDLSADEIWVRIDGDDEDYKLKKENWEQKNTSLDAEKTSKKKCWEVSSNILFVWLGGDDS